MIETTEGNMEQGTSHLALNVRPENWRRRILIVEDDVTAEPLWRHIFNEVSPDVIYRWVGNADAAEYLIRKRASQGMPFDLVISDIFLNGQRTGIDLWQKMSPMVPHFLLVSVLAPEKLYRLIGESPEVPRYFQKPLNPKICVDVLSEMLQTNELDQEE
jgi:DNA-binding NtrC family response regulator